MKAPHPAVSIRALHKSFGPVAAVDGIDLEIATGSVVALLGANGAGKTTALDIVLGLQKPDSGSVRVMGDDVTTAIRQGLVGAILQEGELLPGVRVRELVTCMRDLHREPMPMDEVVERSRIAELLNRRTDRLSGGQAQRVRFALAMVGDPSLLVLDEPTAALDIEARQAFWESVRALASAGRTVIFSTHYLEEADTTAERIVLLGSGKVIADGPTTRIRSIAAARRVRFTLDEEVSADWVASLPGATAVSVRGTAVTLHSSDSDELLRTLFTRYPHPRDVEVTTAPLADAISMLSEANDQRRAKESV